MTITTTGISGLDAQLGGGIPRGTTLLLIAEPSNGIPLFTEQFAGGGLAQGDEVHYFGFDRPMKGLRENITSFVGRGAEDKVRLNLYDGYGAQFGRQGYSQPDPTIQPIQPAYALPFVLSTLQNMSAAEPYRVVLETMSTLTRPENEKEVLDFVRNLVFLGNELGGVHLISIVRGLHSPEFEMQLRHLVGGVMELGVERKGFGLYNYLIVSKLLHVTDPVRILLWKETEKGLWLESTKRVF